MTTIFFYEKPGCSNNAKQKALLAAAGHTVIAKNLLIEPWTRARLLQFFANKPVKEWFNPAAPKIKHGEINPALLDVDSALAMLRADPLLIRRPLIEADGRREVGFDAETMQHWLGITTPAPATCTQTHGCAPTTA